MERVAHELPFCFIPVVTGESEMWKQQRNKYHWHLHRPGCYSPKLRIGPLLTGSEDTGAGAGLWDPVCSLHACLVTQHCPLFFFFFKYLWSYSVKTYEGFFFLIFWNAVKTELPSRGTRIRLPFGDISTDGKTNSQIPSPQSTTFSGLGLWM